MLLVDKHALHGCALGCQLDWFRPGRFCRDLGKKLTVLCALCIQSSIAETTKAMVHIVWYRNYVIFHHIRGSASPNQSSLATWIFNDMSYWTVASWSAEVSTQSSICGDLADNESQVSLNMHQNNILCQFGWKICFVIKNSTEGLGQSINRDLQLRWIFYTNLEILTSIGFE